MTPEQPATKHEYQPDAYRVCKVCGAQGDVLCTAGQPATKRYTATEIEQLLSGVDVDHEKYFNEGSMADTEFTRAAPAIVRQLIDENKRLEGWQAGFQATTVQWAEESVRLRTALEAAEKRVAELEAELAEATETHCDHGTPKDDPCDECLGEVESLSLPEGGGDE